MTLPAIALDARLVGGEQTGDSTYWTGLIHGLSAFGSEAQFLLYTNNSRHKKIPVPGNCSWEYLPGANSRWWSFVSFPLAARRLKASAIHTQYFLSPLVGDVGVTTIHDVSFFLGPQWFRKKDLLLLRATVPASVKRAKAVITVSDSSKYEIEQSISIAKGKTFRTYLACPPWISPVPATESANYVKHRFNVIGPYLLTVGTQWPRKNSNLAISACEQLSAKFPHSLLLTGKEGWGSKVCSSRVVRTGYVSNEELCRLYSAAALYLAPSKHEGFGIPLLEAFRCGCPVLCSSGGALPEIAGEAACVQATWDAQSWAVTIEALLDDSSKLQNLSSRGLCRESEFSWERTARATLDIYLGMSVAGL